MTTTPAPRPRPDFTVVGNQPTIDAFNRLARILADEIGPDFYAGVQTAGWTDRPDSFEGFIIAVPPMVSGVSIDRVVDRIRDEVAPVFSTSSFTDPSGRPAAWVKVDHLPERPADDPDEALVQALAAALVVEGWDSATAVTPFTETPAVVVEIPAYEVARRAALYLAVEPSNGAWVAYAYSDRARERRPLAHLRTDGGAEEVSVLLSRLAALQTTGEVLPG